MANLTDFYVEQHDTREPVTAAALDANLNAIDLSGATVVMAMRDHAGSTITLAGAATTFTPTTVNGLPNTVLCGLKYQWVAADTNIATYGIGVTDQPNTAKFIVTFGDGRVLTFPNTTEFNVHIRAR